ncbi:carboxypeptidase-like regulatory domain-containing protein [Allomuricauda sp.]|uniref:Kelch repeat-containing protein n=1 Tax=Flagellimonas alginolytica TaxID=3177515 RepID=UPI0025CC99CF|nr:carboxypeptidase-like regulatory domain-containing protein [Allomuricauda sp.]
MPISFFAMPINFLMPKTVQITLFLIFSTALGFGQIVKGRVLDMETKQPLDNVNVYIKNSEIGAATNVKGEFRLSYDSTISPTDSLIFSIIGYKTLKIKFSQLKETSNTILMNELTNELGEVIISSKKKLREKLKYHPLSRLKKGVFAFGSIVINDTIYVIGGSESFTEDTMRKAIEDASLKNPYGATWNDVLGETEPNGTNTSYNNKLLTYDIHLDQWKTVDVDFENRAHHQINKFEEKVFVLGGKRVSNNGKKQYLLNKIEILNLDSLSIVIDDTNPHQAIGFASFTYKDNILVMGGSIKMDKAGNKVYTDKCHFFNITSGYWYELEDMTKAKQTDGAIVNEKVYLIGGTDGNPLSEIESLDMSTGKWKKEGDLFYEMENPSITSHDAIIYIYNYGKLLVYNTLANTLKAYNIDLYLKDPDLLYHKNKLYLLGGYTEEKFKKEPSSGLYAIDLYELNKTKVSDSKKLNYP